MGGSREKLIVNLSGDEKKVLGFASWTQVSITAVGIVIGVIFYTMIHGLLKTLGLGPGLSILISAIFFIIPTVIAAYVAFKPIRDSQQNLLYYLNKQLIIDYNYKRREIGTYINIQPNRRPVNASLPYVVKRNID